MWWCILRENWYECMFSQATENHLLLNVGITPMDDSLFNYLIKSIHMIQKYVSRWAQKTWHFYSTGRFMKMLLLWKVRIYINLTYNICFRVCQKEKQVLVTRYRFLFIGKLNGVFDVSTPYWNTCKCKHSKRYSK